MNRAPYQIADLAAVVALVALVSWALAWLGPALDDLDATQRTAQTAVDAQTQADLDWHRDMAAAALCRQQHGEASFTWTAAGELVCIPRHGKKVLASNP